jgi:nucleoid-associated protein YgaU
LGLWYFLGRDNGLSSTDGNFLSRIFRQVEPDTPAIAEPAPAPPAAPQPETAAAPAAPSNIEIEPEPAPEPEPIPEPELPPVIAAPEVAPEPVEAERTRPVPPVRSYRVPATIPRNGAPYRIRWGDTLWDIAEAFYRNPWLYPRIARFNNIRNPDLIISGRTIRVPPRN